MKFLVLAIQSRNRILKTLIHRLGLGSIDRKPVCPLAEPILQLKPKLGPTKSYHPKHKTIKMKVYNLTEQLA